MSVAIVLLVALIYGNLPIVSHAYLATCDSVARVSTGDMVETIMDEMEACYSVGGKICIEVTGSELEELSNACIQYGRYAAGKANYFDVATFCAANLGACWRASYNARSGEETTDVYKTCAEPSSDETIMYQTLYEAATSTCLTEDMFDESSPLARTAGGNLLSQIARGLQKMKSFGGTRASPRGGTTRTSAVGRIG